MKLQNNNISWYCPRKESRPLPLLELRLKYKAYIVKLLVNYNLDHLTLKACVNNTTVNYCNSNISL